jgi:acyl-CoA dehydrogenase
MSASMIEESSARLFAENVDKTVLEKFEAGQWPQKLWSLLVDNGLTLALASESSGGIAASWAESYPILRGLGYWQVPLPLAETMVASLVLSRAGLAIPEGAIALIDEQQAVSLTRASDGTWSGTMNRVPWARYCRWALASTAAGIVLFDIAVDGRAQSTGEVSLIARTNPGLEPVDQLGFANVASVAQAPNPFAQLKEPLLCFGALCRSAMMVGAMEWLLEQSVQYAKDRVQFGKPIGRNQAIQQSLAVMTGDVCAARMAAMVACADAPGIDSQACDSALFSIAVAKVRVGESATRAASIAHQTHGAIGFTYEHALNFATRRLWAWREAYGADAWWAQKLGEAAIQSGAKGFWSGITERQFANLN